jgi:hypothetical protein
MQFSLQTLLLFVTIAAAVFGMTKWLHELGIAISLLTLAFAFIGFGIWSRRKSYIIGGCLLICGLVFSAPWLLDAICWVGHQSISVTVRIEDELGNPIPNATVQLTDHSGKAMASTTGSNGSAHVVGNFQTCGTSTFLSKTGIVELLGESLTVQAGGFKGFHRELGEIVERGYWDLYSPVPPEVRVQLERDTKVLTGHK